MEEQQQQPKSGGELASIVAFAIGFCVLLCGSAFTCGMVVRAFKMGVGP